MTSMTNNDFYAIILAAGKGKRMQDETMPPEFPKVLRQVCGKPMIDYVIYTLKSVEIDDISVIVGFGADYVKQKLGDEFNYVLQTEQLGSGHAVACARESLGDKSGHAVVMCGDSPMFTAATLTSLKSRHIDSNATITMVSAELETPTGYGRIVRNADGQITGVVEEKCASPEEKAIKEVNGGAYALDSQWLWENINNMARNEAGEWNLTDLVRVAVSQGRKVEAVEAAQEEIMGANTPEDLKRLEDILKCRTTSILAF